MSINRAVVIPAISAALSTNLTEARRQGFEAILTAWQADSRAVDQRHLAYVLATAWHETAATMQPVAEYGGDDYKRLLYDVTGRDPDRARRMGNTKPGDGVRYSGRGFVQLTWKNNYALAGRKIGIDLIAHPERAMEPVIAAKIIVTGMLEGWFSGKTLSNYIGGATCDWKGARRIVNGTDKADLIAGYARKIEDALATNGQPRLRRGDAGAAVTVLQRALTNAGYGLGTIDGDFGRKTDAAVRAYQRAHDLDVDGIVGKDTWASLSLLTSED